jgi:hypothetical protein
MNVKILFCPTVIRLSAPSLARELVTKEGKKKGEKRKKFGESIDII